jgi:hypothetical protein
MEGIDIQAIVRQAVQEFVTESGSEVGQVAFRTVSPSVNPGLESLAFTDVLRELRKATGSHPGFNSAHEGYAVILEEMDELRAEVWKRNREVDLMRKEAVQVAAMAIRFLIDVCK